MKSTKQPHVLMTAGSWASIIEAHLQDLGARVTVVTGPKLSKSLYKSASHVLIPGGADIDPSLYGERLTYSHLPDLNRDALELDLVDRALCDGKPLMGICRGHQMICAVAGGSLYQDLGQDTGDPHRASHHLTYTEDGSRLRHLIGYVIAVNSYHHQAVKRLPKGWKVAATSASGSIEAIEWPGHPVTSVQWHPEVLEDKSSRSLFRSFLGPTVREHARKSYPLFDLKGASA